MIETKLRAKLGISVKVFIVLVAFSLGNYAHAGLITGDIGFGGQFTPTHNGNASAIEDATAIDFGPSSVNLAEGDFDAIAFGTLVSLASFSFDPFSSLTLWTVGGFSFELDSVTVNNQDTDDLSLTGTGVLTHLSYDATPGTWNFSGNPAGSYFNFSSGVGTVTVPEPSIIALFGLGLLGLGFARRRKA